MNCQHITKMPANLRIFTRGEVFSRRIDAEICYRCNTVIHEERIDVSTGEQSYHYYGPIPNPELPIRIISMADMTGTDHCPLPHCGSANPTRSVRIAEKNIFEVKPGRTKVCDPCVKEWQTKVVPHRQRLGQSTDDITVLD